MNMQQKPPEVIKSQLALYAGEQYSRAQGGRADTLLKQLGSISLDRIPDKISHNEVPFSTEFSYNEDGTLTADPLFEREEYSELLRHPGSKEVIIQLSEMMKSFVILHPQIQEGLLDQELDSLHPAFYGSGRDNMALLLKLQLEGADKDAIVLVPKPSPDWSEKVRINERAIALAKTRGMHGFEQAIALSYEHSVLVVERVAGKPIEHLTQEEWSHIPDSHKESIRRDVELLKGKGIRLDVNPDNYFYDPVYGFTVIDLGGNIDHSDDEEITRSNLSIIKRICRI